MPVYPGATYRPLNQFANRGTRPRVGVVLHVNASDGPSLYNWIAGNNGMSCHFQVAKSGAIEQYVDTDNGSWCQMAGNDTYLSIETQGFPTEPLTAAQVAACAGIMRWLRDTHGIPLTIADAVGQRGLGWHGMGGAAWGGHTGCPGEARKAQRAEILTLAGGPAPSGGTATPITGGDMPLSQQDIDAVAAAVWNRTLDKRNNMGPGPAWMWLTDMAAAAADGRNQATVARGDAAAARQGVADLLARPAAGTATVDVPALATSLAATLGPDIGRELVAALGAALRG